MRDEYIDPIDEQYGSWTAQIHRELWAFEGAGPPDNAALATVAQDELGGAIELLADLEEHYDIPDDAEDYIQMLRGDMLKAYVALQLQQGQRGKPDAFDGSEDDA
jgi:hypothetical protein